MRPVLLFRVDNRHVLEWKFPSVAGFPRAALKRHGARMRLIRYTGALQHAGVTLLGGLSCSKNWFRY